MQAFGHAAHIGDQSSRTGCRNAYCHRKSRKIQPKQNAAANSTADCTHHTGRMENEVARFKHAGSLAQSGLRLNPRGEGGQKFVAIDILARFREREQGGQGGGKRMIGWIPHGFIIQHMHRSAIHACCSRCGKARQALRNDGGLGCASRFGCLLSKKLRGRFCGAKRRDRDAITNKSGGRRDRCGWEPGFGLAKQEISECAGSAHAPVIARDSFTFSWAHRNKRA